MSETVFESEVLSRLSTDFVVRKRVPGTHFSGKHFVLDAVVTPNEPQRWANRNIALGIEFKDVIRLRGDTKNFTSWLSQCIDYSNTCWDRFGYIHIFACPSLIDDFPAGTSASDVRRVLNAIMGRSGIGELCDTQLYGLSFILYGHHRIWSETEGVEEGKRYKLIRTFGSK